jgi:predicted nucleotidyltransferase
MFKSDHFDIGCTDGRTRTPPASHTGTEKTVRCSDVDVLVLFRKGEETFDNYMSCKFYLEDLFGRNVDLVMKGAIKKRLKPYIIGEVVYA